MSPEGGVEKGGGMGGRACPVRVRCTNLQSMPSASGVRRAMKGAPCPTPAKPNMSMFPKPAGLSKPVLSTATGQDKRAERSHLPIPRFPAWGDMKIIPITAGEVYR